jgi:hypothetical protein
VVLVKEDGVESTVLALAGVVEKVDGVESTDQVSVGVVREARLLAMGMELGDQRSAHLLHTTDTVGNFTTCKK